MRIKRAATLVCTFEGDKPVVHNFLKKEMFECNARALDILARLDDWQTMEDALARLPGPLEATTELLKDLISRDLVLLEDSPAAERDQRYRDHWRWGASAAFYQFGMRDSPFLSEEEQVARMGEYRHASPSPALLSSHAGIEESIELPDFDLEDPFYRELWERQSRREYSGEPIPLDVLADCLFAGKGLKEVQDCGEFGFLPKTMTPSGGARNPFDLYVYVRNVAGLEAGFYHYSTAEHSLAFLHDDERPVPAELLGGLKWANNAAAIIFLTATFERTAWKYRQPLAWRVVLMEVGAILQNVELVACHRGIPAAPTGALAESRVDALLGLKEIEQAALFAMVLGAPATSSLEGAQKA